MRIKTSRPWLGEEENLLRELYPTRTRREVSEEFSRRGFKRTPSAIGEKVLRLGISKPFPSSWKIWEEEELDILVTYYEFGSRKVIEELEKIGSTATARQVGYKANRLGAVVGESYFDEDFIKKYT